MYGPTTLSTAQRPRGTWFKSTRSGGGSDCVEVCHLHDGGVAIRDSKNPDAYTLAVTRTAFTSFVAYVRNENVPQQPGY